MLRVALTGGMGAGKTLAANIFRELGCFVSQSDEVARAMMQPGQQVYAEIVHAFGRGIVRADESLDRRALADLAFSHGRLEELNAVVHPAVIARQTAWMQEVENQHPRAIAMVESALVFETRHGAAAAASTTAEAAPWRTQFDRIVLITAAEELRVERYLSRVGASSSTEERAFAEANARARMRAQMPEVQKEALADFVVRNEGSVSSLRTLLQPVYRQLQQEAEDRVEESM